MLFWGASTLSPKHWGGESAKGGENTVFMTSHLIKTRVSAYQHIRHQLWVEFYNRTVGRTVYSHLSAIVRHCVLSFAVVYTSNMYTDMI